MKFVKQQKSINTRVWMKELKKRKKHSAKAKNTMVYEFLYNNGYRKVAEIFRIESGLNEAETEQFNHQYAEVKDLVVEKLLKDEFDETMEMLESVIPGFFDNNPDLLIEMNLLKFIRIIKEGDNAASVRFAKQQLIGVTCEENKTKYKAKLVSKVRTFLTLLAYKDLSKFPKPHYLKKNYVLKVCNKINKKLSTQNIKESRLEKLYTLIKFYQDNIEFNKNYSKLERVTPLDLKFQQSDEERGIEPIVTHHVNVQNENINIELNNN